MCLSKVCCPSWLLFTVFAPHVGCCWQFVQLCHQLKRHDRHSPVLALWSLDSLSYRKGDLRPTNGQVYEDVAADLAAQAAAQAVAVGAAAPASSRAASQDPATASSGRPKRARRQTQFLDGRHVVKPGNESDDSSNDSGESSASRRRKGQRISMQTKRSVRVQPSVQQLWSSDQQTECNNSTSHHPLPGVDKAEQDTLGSGQPSSSMHVLDSRQIQNSHSDGHGRQQVQKPDAEAVLINNITAVSARERRVQTNTILDDSEEEEEEQAAVRGGSQSTIFESDDDDDKVSEASLQEAVLLGAASFPVVKARVA